MQRLLEALDRGGDGCRPPALRLMREVFLLPVSSPQQLLPPASLTAALLQPLARRLDEPHAPLALQVVSHPACRAVPALWQAEIHAPAHLAMLCGPSTQHVMDCMSSRAGS